MYKSNKNLEQFNRFFVGGHDGCYYVSDNETMDIIHDGIKTKLEANIKRFWLEICNL